MKDSHDSGFKRKPRTPFKGKRFGPHNAAPAPRFGDRNDAPRAAGYAQREYTPRPGGYSKPAFGGGDRPSFGDRPRFGGGDRPAFGDRGGRPSFGGKPSFGGRPSFGGAPRFGDKPRFGGGDRPSFGDRPRFGGGDRPAFGDRGGRPSFGGKPSFGGRPSFGDRPRYEDRGARPAYNSDRPSYGDKPRFGGGDRPSFGDRGDRPAFGDRPRFGDKPCFGDKPRFGGKPSFDGKREDKRPERGYLASAGTRTTSWNDVADWYDDHLTGDDTYHSQVVLPNILRIVAPRPAMKVVELGSGQGFFSIELAKRGATVVGVELGEDLAEKARENAREAGVADKTAFVVAAAEKCDMVKADDADMVLVILALQNMRFIDDVVAQIARITKVGAKVVIVLNHPAFRVPKQSSWGYDRVMDKQYRRVDRYMSELEARIDMRPGATASKGAPVTETISFHRPLSAFVTAFGKKNMSMVAMEEWISHKESESGPRKAAEDTSRREIPLFMCMSFRKDA